MSRADFLRALTDLPAKHRAWLEDGSIDLWAYYGFGVVLNDAQLEHLTAVLTWPPGTIHVWRWANRTGKGQPLDEPVLTPQGWRPIGDLRVGDPIMAGDGSATIVTGVYPQGPKAVFRLTFDDGAWTRCDESHLWTVLDPSARFKRPGEVRRKGAWTGGRLAARFRQWDTLSLAEIRRRWGDRPPPSQRCAIPTAPTAQLTARPVPVEPYLLGLLLGDGGVSGDSVRFTTADPELAAAVGGRPIGRTAYEYSVRGLQPALRSLGLMGKHSYDKSVPREYLDNAPDIRLAVLQGLMDTDGSVQTNGHVEFSSTSQRLAADVVELVRSLGGRAKAVERQTYYRYGGQRRAGRRSWRVHVRAGTVPLFRLPRKAERLAAWRQRWAGDRLLYSIEAIGEAETVCIRVADPSETYITRDYIVTHNTTGLDLLYGWAAWYKWRYIAPEFDDWFAYRYKILHSAPLGELAGKAYELWEELLSGAAMQQRDPINQRQRPALLAPFFAATKIVDATGVDRPAIHCANGAQIDFRSTQGKAARLESDSWWLIGWDEFPRQLPSDDIPVIFDQTMLPRSSDFLAPVVLAGTATVESEHIYAEFEEIAAANPSDWNFTEAARTANFAQSHRSIDRQRRLSINKDVAERSLGGKLGGGASSLYPAFLLANAFDETLPEVQQPPTNDDAWTRFATTRTFLTGLDHALAHDDNVLLTLDVPWPPATISPANPIIGSHIEIVRGSRTLTGDEVHAYLSREVRTYRSRAAIIDSTGPGGLHVYRKARQDGLPAVDCNLQGREAKWVTNKEAGLQGLQRLLSFGLPVAATEGFIDEWPTPEGAFGLFRFPAAGPWQKLRRQLAVLRRADEKQRQDAAMALIMLSWYLWKLIGHARAPRSQTFNVMAGGRNRRYSLARR